MKKILEGIKVVGFETAGAGPTASKLMAEYGADVVMIEPVTGINTRGQIDFDFYFLHKKSIAINMKTTEGMEIVHKLLAKADVFVSNYRKRAVDKFGLDYDSLHAKYPRLIHATLTGYGEHGPMKDAPGFDTTAYWGRAGLAMSCRERDGDPIVTPSSVGDIGSGTMLFGGIMAALYHRERTGEAMKVYISLFGAGVWQNNEQMFQAQYGLDYPLTRLKPRRVYANTYLLKDNYFHFHTLDPDRDMPKIMHIIGRDDVIEKYTGHWKDEGETAIEIREIMDEGFKNMTNEEAKAKFKEQDIAFGEICSPIGVIEDPQAEANQLLYRHKMLYTGKEYYFAASALKFMDDTPCEDGPAPRLGQHTVELMRESGYTEEEIQDMIQRKIVVADGE